MNRLSSCSLFLLRGAQAYLDQRGTKWVKPNLTDYFKNLLEWSTTLQQTLFMTTSWGISKNCADQSDICISLFQGDSGIPGKDGMTGDPVSVMILSCKEVYFKLFIIQREVNVHCLCNIIINATSTIAVFSIIIIYK